MHSFRAQNNIHLLVDRPELVVVGLIFVCCFGWIDFGLIVVGYNFILEILDSASHES